MQLELVSISKRFGQTLANDDVALSIGEGEVLALLGENGAGKSTLMKCLYGYYRLDAGQILVDGREVSIASPRDAMRLGIGMVFQQFSLIPALTVKENLLLAHPEAPVWHGRGNTAGMLGLLAEFAPGVRADTPVAELSVGQKQQVELVKVLNQQARLVILDEPTSVLTPEEAQRLHAIIRQLAATGRSVVLITHKLEDVRACAQRVVVMRGGRVAAEVCAADIDEHRLVELMVGTSDVTPTAISLPQRRATRLEMRKVSCRGETLSLQEISLDISAGEILGVAGVSGNGQDLLADAVSGLAALDAGEVLLDGELLQGPVTRRPDDARVGYIPEYPLKNAVAAEMSNSLNLALRELGREALFPDQRRSRAHAEDLMEVYDVRPRNPDLASGRLSGGNLQKLVIARELSQSRLLVVACYPTMGLDLQAARAVYEALFRQAEEGAAILWISEDLDDLLSYAHRIAVLHHGRLVGILPAAGADRTHLGQLMAGGRVS